MESGSVSGVGMKRETGGGEVAKVPRVGERVKEKSMIQMEEGLLFGAAGDWGSQLM